MAAFTWNIPAATDQSIGASVSDSTLSAINTVVAANSGAAGAKWQVANYASGSPRSVLLKRKSGAPGRIIIFGEAGSTPNSAALKIAGSSGGLYIGYSPTSTSNTPDASWISAAPLSASDYIKAMRACLLTNATWRINYAESEDCFFIIATNASSGRYVFGAGETVENLSGTAVSALHGCGTAGSANWATTASNGGSIFPGTVGSNASYTDTDAGLQVAVSGSNRMAFRCMMITTSTALPKLNDTSNTKVYFLPIPLVFNNDDVTFSVLGKVRQIGFGPICARETTYTGGGVTAYGAAQETASPTYPGVWFVDAEL